MHLWDLSLSPVQCFVGKDVIVLSSVNMDLGIPFFYFSVLASAVCFVLFVISRGLMLIETFCP